MYVLCLEVFVVSFFFVDEFFSFKGSNVIGISRCDSLFVFFVLDVIGGEDIVDRSLGGVGNSFDVFIVVKFNLRFDEGSGGFVVDGIEEIVDGEVFDFISFGVFDGK